MKRTLLAVLLSTFFSSCMTYMEVFHTSPTNSATIIDKHGYPIFENDTIRVVYEFWDDAGRMSFIITNKYSKPIYVDWKKCSYIRGGDKKDYYEESVSSSSVSVGSSYRDVFGIQRGSSGSIGKSVKNERVAFIPPGSSIAISSGYYISHKIAKVNDWGVVKKNLKEKKEHLIKIDQADSRVRFRNFITYSITENFAIEQYVDNGFYLSSVSLLPYIGSGSEYASLKELYQPRSYYHVSIKKNDLIRVEKPNQKERL